MSAAEGSYSRSQLLLDISQGTRLASSSYDSPEPPALRLERSAAGEPSSLLPWRAILDRAHAAPMVLEPGLLAATVPGGAGFVGVTGGAQPDAALAAGRAGHVAAVSIGSSSTLLERIAAMETNKKLLVADLPGGRSGEEDLRALSSARRAGELEIVIALPGVGERPSLLWAALGGLGATGEETELTSHTTSQRGLFVSIDVAPTILEHLGLAVPDAMQGRAVEVDGEIDGNGLRSLKARLEAIGGRRLEVLAGLLAAWSLLLLGALAAGRARWGAGQARARATRATAAYALRVGALAMLWTPVASLVAAALEPGLGLEVLLLAASCSVLGALCDRLLPWPRAPLAPAAIALLALSADALLGTQLLMRSLLGPDPAYGARFHGIGNELKSALAVLTFAGVAAALHPGARGRRVAGTMALSGVVLCAIEGSSLIGAGVGSVVLVSAGAALATLLLLPRVPTRRKLALALLSPALALGALAALDLFSAHLAGRAGTGLPAIGSAGEAWDAIARRYGAAWRELGNGAMPAATAFALVAAVIGVARRERVLRPVSGDPAWFAALCGGLAAGVIGSLVEDSGPVLLVVAVFTLACVLAYLWGAPQRGPAAGAVPGATATASFEETLLEPTATPRPTIGSQARRTRCTRSTSTPTSSTAPPTRLAASPTTSPSTGSPSTG